MGHINFEKASNLAAYGSQDVVGYPANTSKATCVAINSPNLICQHRPSRFKATRKKNLRGPWGYVARDGTDYRGFIPPVVLTIRQNDRRPYAALFSSSRRS